jgi:hypothetical protein
MAQQTTGTVVLAWKTSGSKTAAKKARDIEAGIGRTGLAAGKTKTPFMKMSSSIESIDKRTRKWALGLKTVVGAIAALKVVKVATGWLKDAATNALEDEDSSRRLAIALRNTTHATKAQTAGVEEWISKQALAFGFVDDKLRPALQRLAQSTHDIGAAQRMTSLAMDVSAGSGKSLEAVATALAKAQAGNMGALSRLGIRIKDVHGKALSFTRVVKEMAITFKGQASAAAESAAGRFARLSIQWDEMKETLGYKLLPKLARLGSYLLDRLVPAVQRVIDDWDNWRGSMLKLHHVLANAGVQIRRGSSWMRAHGKQAQFAAQAALSLWAAIKLVSTGVTVAKTVIGAYNGIIKVSTALTGAYRMQAKLYELEQLRATVAREGLTFAEARAQVVTKKLTITQWALNAALNANPFGLIVVGVTALVAAFILAYTKVDWFRNGVNSAFTKIVGDVRGAIDWIKHNWVKLLVILTGPIGMAVAVISKAIGGVVIRIAKNFGKIVSVVRGVVAKLKSPLNMMIRMVNGFIDGINMITGGAPKLWSWAGIPAIPAIPHIPTLATGGRVETSGRLVRVAEAGKPENVFTDAQLGNLMGFAAARMQTTPSDSIAASLPNLQSAPSRGQAIQLVTPTGQVLMEWIMTATGARLARA